MLSTKINPYRSLNTPRAKEKEKRDLLPDESADDPIETMKNRRRSNSEGAQLTKVKVGSNKGSQTPRAIPATRSSGQGSIGPLFKNKTSNKGQKKKKPRDPGVKNKKMKTSALQKKYRDAAPAGEAIQDSIFNSIHQKIDNSRFEIADLLHGHGKLRFPEKLKYAKALATIVEKGRELKANVPSERVRKKAFDRTRSEYTKEKLPRHAKAYIEFLKGSLKLLNKEVAQLALIAFVDHAEMWRGFKDEDNNLVSCEGLICRLIEDGVGGENQSTFVNGILDLLERVRFVDPDEIRQARRSVDDFVADPQEFFVFLQKLMGSVQDARKAQEDGEEQHGGTVGIKFAPETVSTPTTNM